MAMRDVLENSAHWATRWSVDRVRAFRATSRYFQGKVALVALYLVIVVFTVALTPPPSKPWHVTQELIPFGLAFRTAIDIASLDEGDLDVVLDVRGRGIDPDGSEVTGTWPSKPMRLIEGKHKKVLTEQLFDPHGHSPPYSLLVDTVTVLDDELDILTVLRPLLSKAAH